MCALSVQSVSKHAGHGMSANSSVMGWNPTVSSEMLVSILSGTLGAGVAGSDLDPDTT